MTLPTIGDKVHVKPAGAARVRFDIDLPKRFLPPDGMTVAWSPWLADKLRAGEIVIVNPATAEG